MEETKINTIEKKSVKDKIIDFAKTNKNRLLKGAAIVGGTLVGAGLLGFVGSKIANSCDYDDEYYDEDEIYDICEADFEEIDALDSDEEDSEEE